MKKICLVIGLSMLLLCGTVHSAGYAPAMPYARFLNSITMATNGKLFLGTFTGTFLPANATGNVILRTAAGEELIKWDFASEPLQPPFSKINLLRYTDPKTGVTQSGSGIDLTQCGEFVLDFYLPSGLFYTYPFSVKKLESADPFAGGPVYYLSGDWERWGYINYDNADPENNLFWCIWLRHPGFEPHKTYRVRVEISRDKDKKVVFQHDQDQNLSQQWQRYELTIGFAPPNPKAGSAIQAKDLLAVDGPCTLVMKLDGQLYGTWKFNIAGGKFQYIGRTDRTKADSKTFIEGGNDIFFYEKS